MRPSAAGLRGRLTALSTLRSTGPCWSTVPSGAARPAAPRESEMAILVGHQFLALVTSLVGRGRPPGPPDTALPTKVRPLGGMTTFVGW